MIAEKSKYVGHSRKRMKKETVVKKVIFGTAAFARGKKADKNYKNAWWCYVRAPLDENGGDMSSYVSKVVFTLHDSFPHHIMVVDKFPFCICRAGWGEFDIMITIYFHDPNEEPVQRNYPL